MQISHLSKLSLGEISMYLAAIQRDTIRDRNAPHTAVERGSRLGRNTAAQTEAARVGSGNGRPKLHTATIRQKHGVDTR